MSRSKRAPYWTEGYGGKMRKKMKTLSNKKARRAKIVPQGAGYKKILDSWTIRDFSFHDPKNWKALRK